MAVQLEPGESRDEVRQDRPRCVETHISWVLLSEDRAFKVPKPVVTDVVDQGTLEARRRTCEREVELNRRIAPDVYLGVGNIELDGEQIEPVIVMERLPERRRLSSLLSSPEAPNVVSAVARAMAAFHSSARVLSAGEARSVASVMALRDRWSRDLACMRDLVGPQGARPDGSRMDPRGTRAPAGSLLALTEAIGRSAHRYLAGRGLLLRERIADGMIRDGHGDLLADDVFCLEDGPRILDCLAFSDQLRHNDVLADVAFLVMDLQWLGYPDLARHFLSEYGSFSGEHHPGSLAHLYVAQRALVRAKVSALRSEQDSKQHPEVGRLLKLAADHLDRATVRMVLVGGLPGSGKSTIADRLAADTGWAFLASDEIRRDLGLRYADLHVDSAYDAATVAVVYREMRRRARRLLERGVSVILDATWTLDHERGHTRRLARETYTDVVEIRCDASEGTCRSRVAGRSDRSRSEATPDVVRSLAARTDPWPEAFVLDTGEASPNQVLSEFSGEFGSGGLWGALERR